MPKMSHFDTLISVNSYIGAIWKFDNPRFLHPGTPHFHVIVGESEDGFLFLYITSQSATITNHLDNLGWDYSSAVPIYPSPNNRLTFDSFIVCYQVFHFDMDEIFIINRSSRINFECGCVNETEYEQIRVGIFNKKVPTITSKIVESFNYKDVLILK